MWSICTLLLCLLAANAELELRPPKQLYTMLLDVYRGQLPCMPEAANGTRRLLTFDLDIENVGAEVVRELPSIHYSLRNNTTSVLEGTLSTNCLRDSICDEPYFYTCRGLSVGCRFHRPAGSECQWIDVSGLSVRNFELTLSLDNSTVVLQDDLRTLSSMKRSVVGDFFFVFIPLTLLVCIIVFEPPLRKR